MIIEVAVYMAPNEWSSRVSMRDIAIEQLDALPADYQTWSTCVVHEHGGWWLMYARVDSDVVCVGSANDQAVYPEHVRRWWHYRNELTKVVGVEYRSVKRQ